MATYTVKSPDGKTITLQGPDGASQADIIAQAQKLYQPKAAPAAPAAPAPNQNQAAILARYNYLRNTLSARESTPEAQAAFRAHFDADPRAQAMRKAAGLAPLSTVQGDVQNLAKQAVSAKTAQPSVAGALWRGIQNGIPGMDYLRAAANEAPSLVDQTLGTHLDANPGMTYADRVRGFQRLGAERDAADASAHPIAHYGGEIAGNILTAAAGGAAVKAGAEGLAASSAPAAAKVGNVLQKLTTLQKGQKLANAGRLVAGGATAGAAYSAGNADPSDIASGTVKGAETGAVAAPVVAGAGSLAGRFLVRPAADILGLSNAGSYLRRFTDAPLSDIKQALADRQAAGAQPTLFEVLPQADRNRLMEHTIAGRDPVIERVLSHIQDRAANVGPEMADMVHAATYPQRLQIQRQMVSDLETARGSSSGQPVPGAPGEDAQTALMASHSPTGMQDLYHKEASLIMAPHDDTPVVDKFSDLLPQHPVTNADGSIQMTETDPELSSMVRTAAGRLAARKPGDPINVGEVSNVISRLRNIAFKGGNEGALAENAASHLEDVIGQNAPEAGQAVQQMRTAYAARKRMAEGMKEGWFTRLQDAQQIGTNDSAGKTLGNAYNTPEGQTGLFLGQANRLLHDFGASPNAALNTAGDIATGDTSRELAQNVGQEPADQIGTAAQAQAAGIKTLSSAGNQAQSGSGNVGDGTTLAQGILALSPHSFITTKMHWLKQLGQATFIPTGKAKAIGDMLFSTDSQKTQKALDYLSTRGSEGQNLAAKLVSTLPVAAAGAAASSSAPAAPTPQASDLPAIPDVASSDADTATPQAPAATPAAPAAPTADDQAAAAPADGSSPYAPVLQHIYSNENPDLINLVGRVKAQESGGQQFGPDGQPLTSRAGAVGVMQVEPGTGPEAAKLAGVPWDSKAYAQDPAYNEVIGIGYLSELLRKYKGNVARALAAYNAGSGKVDTALSNHGGDWLAAMPSETQDYVQRVAS